MGRQALDGDVQPVVGGSSDNDGLQCVVVQEKAPLGCQQTHVKVAYPQQANLFLPADGNLQGGVDIGGSQGVQQLGDTGLVVGSENRLSRGTDHSVLQERLDPLAGFDRVGVAGEEHRSRGLRVFPGDVGDQVAVTVFPDLPSQGGELPGQILDELGLLSGFARDLNHLHKLVDHPFAHVTLLPLKCTTRSLFFQVSCPALE
ncbi:MAG: hypothetical protein BWY86_01342 [Candidatus Aminicenantes bacterium ADurb.Bin508]|nr:MAG: hypothetical protein BWY86_01342 [Candidatus Aminicenantes bacterium ADurb.Bin508]